MGKRIIIAGGGTGGHIFPALAIANALKQQDPSVTLLFIGAKDKMEMQKVPQAGYEIEGLDIAGFNRSSLIKNIGLPLKLIRSFFRVRQIFSRFRPDAVIGVGGYSSFPVLRYAQQKGIASFLHESNSFAGKSNQMLGRKATRIFVASAGMEKFFPAEKIMVTGNPVRAAIAESVTTREEAIRLFGLDPALVTILSVGGSLGAKTINEAIAAGLPLLKDKNLQLIWQTGKPFAAQGRSAAAAYPNVWVGEFITEMDKAYAAADIIISRAGAMAIAEIALVRKPAILVPYPFAAEDHQTENARQLANRNAAILVRDDTVKTALLPAALDLAANPDMQAAMSAQLEPLGIKDADRVIAREILQIIQ